MQGQPLCVCHLVKKNYKNSGKELIAAIRIVQEVGFDVGFAETFVHFRVVNSDIWKLCIRVFFSFY